MLPPHRPFRHKPATKVTNKKRNFNTTAIGGNRLKDQLSARPALLVMKRKADAANHK